MAIDKNAEKMKALDAVLLQIEKQYGKGSIMRLGDEAGNAEIDVIPSGCLTLDLALGIGGFPRGRIIEIYGPESSGKTTVALHAIAETQKLGGVAAFIEGWLLKICTTLNPMRANRRWISATRSCAVRRWT